MNALWSLIVVLVLAALALAGGSLEASRTLFGVLLPYAALMIFLAGVAYKVAKWAFSPVPFRIPTTAGQQKTLPWIKYGYLENPFTAIGVVLRMALEILLFRSLFRNTKAELRQGPQLVYGENKWLWVAALAFHWSFLIILLRHFRFFLEPVPALVNMIAAADGFFQIGAPVLYATDVVILVALAYLLFRRFQDSQVRYISLFSDYFALYLLLGLAGTGVLMRYFIREDVVAVKQLALGIATFHPLVPKEVGAIVIVHIFLLSVLVAYFPFSKLMHAGGVFLSPTRNLANNNRASRHVNPWNYPVKTHTYAEWEEEFHDKMKAAGMPLDKE